MKQIRHNVTDATTQTKMSGMPYLTAAKAIGLALLACLAVQSGFAEPTELTALRMQRDKAIAQAQQQAQAKESRINEQYIVSLDTLMSSLTRAGKLDAALAVRDEKTRVNTPPGDGIVRQTTAIAKSLPQTSQNRIVEGEGLRGFRVGATREELVKALGNPDTDSTNQWLKWKKLSVHCLLDDKSGAFELRFDDGFKGETVAGIAIGSTLKKTLAAYGEPTTSEDNGRAKKLSWSSKGILIWLNEDKVSQIVVFPKK